MGIQTAVDAQVATILDTTAVSDSLYDHGRDLVGLEVPELATGTTRVGFDVSSDPPSVADGDATWLPVYDKDNALYTLAITAATAARRQIPSGDLLRLGRFRLHTYGASTEQVQDDDYEIRPLFRFMR